MTTVGDCVRILESRYDPRWAESWDAVGLAVGDLSAAAKHVVFAVDPTPEVAAEAVAAGAQLLVTHHPLFLRGTHSVAATTPRGRVVHTLVRGGCALFTAHTNADVARPGVSDALAATLGVLDTEPLSLPAELAAATAQDKLVVFVPQAERAAVLDALSAAGGGHIGDYERCAWWTTGTGTFRPVTGADPSIGAVGRVEEVTEDRLELVIPRSRRTAVIAALRSAHSYEEPAFDVIPVDTPDQGARAPGLGRIGPLGEATTLDRFCSVVAESLPHTAAGVRAAGDPDRVVRRVAVCGGSGGGLAGAAAAAGADVLVTADGRHHSVLDSVLETGLALVDVAHWASEWPWLADAARLLTTGLAAAGMSVTTDVSATVTDPWRLHPR